MHNARNRNGSRKCCYSRGRGKALKEEEEEDAYKLKVRNENTLKRMTRM